MGLLAALEKIMDDMKILEIVSMISSVPDDMRTSLQLNLARYEQKHRVYIKDMNPALGRIFLCHTGWTREEREFLHGCLFYSGGEVQPAL